MIEGYAVALAATVAVEVPVYARGLPRVGDVAPWSGAAAGLAVNLATHPWAWLLAWPHFEAVLGPGPGFVLLEAIVCFVEWRALRAWRRFDGPLLAALVLLANAASLAAGTLVAL